MTVNMLIQIDKLVQLLESPVFTCKVLKSKNIFRSLTCKRFATSASRTGKVSTFVQVSLWAFDVASSIIRFRRIEESTEQRQRNWLSTHRPTNVRYKSLMLISVEEC